MSERRHDQGEDAAATQAEPQRQGEPATMMGGAAAAIGSGALQRKLRDRRERNRLGAPSETALDGAALDGDGGRATAKSAGGEKELAEAEVSGEGEEKGGGGGDVLNWPSVLPLVHRTGKQAITAKPYKLELNIPKVDAPKFTAEQQALVDQIKANRAALPSLLTAKDATRGGYAGYKYHDSRQAGEPTPDELKGGDKSRETAVKKIAWDEIGHEGGLDGINTNDDQILTWGKGFSHNDLARVMGSLFKEDPEAEKMLLRAGIAVHGNTWMVVSCSTGGVETDNNALHLLQFDPKLLTVFIQLGQGQHAQHAANAQWTEIKSHGGSVPKYAYEWPENAIRLAAHLTHWVGFGWWQETGGDVAKIATRFARTLAQQYGTKTESGAVVLKAYDLGRPGHRFDAFANGAAAKALAHTRVTITDEQLKTDKALAGHLCIPIEGQAYYDLGSG